MYIMQSAIHKLLWLEHYCVDNNKVHVNLCIQVQYRYTDFYGASG